MRGINQQCEEVLLGMDSFDSVLTHVPHTGMFMAVFGGIILAKR